MPYPTVNANALRGSAREQAKQRVLRVFHEGGDWKLAAIHNDIPYNTARRAILNNAAAAKPRGGVRQVCVKMTVEVMAKLEEYIDEDCRATLTNLCDRLRSDLGVVVGKSSVHRALQGMLYSTKKIRIEKSTMNNSNNKIKRKTFVEKLDDHVAKGNMIVYQDETNFNLYLSRSQGWSRIGDRAIVQLPPSQGKNLHVQGGVSALTGLVLLRTHEGSITKDENARFIADLFVAALRTEEYRELPADNKIVIVTDNAPAHSSAEDLARQLLVSDGIVNGQKLEILRLGPYSPMLNPIEGYWNVLKSKMRLIMASKKDAMLVRGEYSTYTAQRVAIMKEAVDLAMPSITRRLVWSLERHAAKLGCTAKRGDDMELGK